jgi:hypothetical protein
MSDRFIIFCDKGVFKTSSEAVATAFSVLDDACVINLNTMRWILSPTDSVEISTFDVPYVWPSDE